MNVIDSDRDNWTTSELSEGDAYSTDLHRVLEQEIVKVQPPKLSDEKNAVVQITVLLEIASRIAHDRLQISEDDFAVHALEVFNKRSAGGSNTRPTRP